VKGAPKEGRKSKSDSREEKRARGKKKRGRRRIEKKRKKTRIVKKDEERKRFLERKCQVQPSRFASPPSLS